MKKVFLMLAVVAMASCSKSELAERPIAGDVEIKMNSVALGIESRAPFVGSIATDNHLTAKVLASTEKGKYLTGDATMWADDNIEFGKGTAVTDPVGFNTPVYYPADASKEVHLFGLYPTTGWTVDAADGLTATYTIDGCSDIMTAETATTKKSDVQVVSPATPSYPKLSFKHLLTKLNVKVVAEKIGEAADADQPAVKAWGAITKIELVKGLNEADPQNSCKVTFADNTVVFDGTGVMPFYLASEDASNNITYEDVKVGEEVDGSAKNIDLTTTAALAAYSIVAPVEPTSGSDVIKLKVYTENQTDGKEVSVSLKKDASTPVTGSTAGKEYTITLTFKATEMLVQGEVTAWTDGGSGEQDVD